MKRTLLACALGLACTATPALAQTSAYALLLPDNQLAFAIPQRGAEPTAARSVTGVEAGDQLVAIDVRPQNGRLYALGNNPKTGTVRLYLLDLAGPMLRATALGSAAQLARADGSPLPILAAGFDIDFNPSVDRLRVVSTGGLNFRMNPNTGALVDGDFGTPGTPSPGVNPDGNLNAAGSAEGAMGTAYSNSVINTAITTQYSLSAASNTLYLQNPPNAGSLVQPLPISFNGSPLDFGSAGGLDIEPSVSAAASNQPASGAAVATLTVGGIAGLYRIDLGSGAATRESSLGGLSVLGFALLPDAPTALVLADNGDQLGRLPLADPSAARFVSISGVAAGERLVGIDLRPATGQLYALGIDADTDAATLYLLDPQSGATATATAVGTPGQIAWVDGSGQRVDLSDLPAGFDFNPTVDRIRFVDASGLNARINPENGAAVDGDAGSAGINPDGMIQAELGTQLVGTAYTGSVPMAPLTTQYTLDQGFGRLSIQNPPNNGVQTEARRVRLDGVDFDFAGGSGFDIPPGVTGAAANAVAVGLGYFTANDTQGVPSLYALRLDDASAERVGAVANAPAAGLSGLVVADAARELDVVARTVTAPRGGSARIEVVLLSGSSGVAHLRTRDGSALAGGDYSARAGSVFVSGGSARASFDIAISAEAQPGRLFEVLVEQPGFDPIIVSVRIVADGDALFADGFESP